MNLSSEHLPARKFAGNRTRQTCTLSRGELLTAKAIGLISPKAAVRFMASRLVLNRSIENLSEGGRSGYQAAQRHGPNQGWNPTTRSSEDSILSADAPYIRARARDLVRNNGYVAGAVQRIVNNVVHKGIKPQIKVVTGKGEKLDREVAQSLEKAWKKWCKRTKFKRHLKLNVRHFIVDGEFFALRYLRPELTKEKIVPLWIKGVEADQVDASNSSIFSGKKPTNEIIRNGIAYNEHDEPIAYYMYPFHPGDISLMGSSWAAPVRVDAKYVGHLYAPNRSSQHRGVSVVAPVVMSMHDIHELTNSELIAARLMAAFGVFISAPPSGMDPAQMGGNDPDTVKSQLDELTEYVESGRIQILPDGAQVQQVDNNRPGPQFDAISQTTLRQGASGLGQDYESFSGDYRGSSFSSARSASLETRRGYQVITDLLVDESLDPTFEMWLLAGRISRTLHPDTPEEVSVRWVGSGWPWIDPLKDIKAKTAEIELGVTTRTEVAASQGKDFEEVVEQLAVEQKILKEKGLLPKQAENQGAPNA